MTLFQGGLSLLFSHLSKVASKHCSEYGIFSGGVQAVMRCNKTCGGLLITAVCLALAGHAFAQQSSTNNNDPSYPALGRRATTINHDNGSTSNIGLPQTGRRTTNADPTNAGGGNDVGPFGTTQVIDGDFVWEVGGAALMEMELAKVAAEKGQSEDVKKLGQSVIKGHERMHATLQSIATEHNLKIPTELDAKRKARVDQIAKLSGAEFDRAYLRHLISYYERGLGRFDFEAANGTIPELASWAGRVAPRIQHQIRAAKEDLRSSRAAAAK